MGTTVGAGLVVDEMDAATLGADDAQQLAELLDAVSAVDSPHLAPEPARRVQLRWRHGWEGYPLHRLLVARTPGGAPVGLVEVDITHWDNPDLSELELSVHPAHRTDDAVADVLLRTALEAVRASGRTNMVANAWRDSWLAGFWQRQGWPVVSRAAQRRIVLADLDRDRVDGLLASAEQASEAYDIDVLPWPTPEHLVEGLLDVHRAMNDAPLDDLEIADDVWTVPRLVASEAAFSEREIRMHRLIARRRADGVVGGYTVLMVDEAQPTIGHQDDTSVVGEHRGHRLGLRLKATMLRRLATVEPQLETIDTWNAESNTHMLAVNDLLGCVVVGRGELVQRQLD